VRPEDLCALRFELIGCELVPGAAPKVRQVEKPAVLVLHFPPQAIAEAVFYETPHTPGMKEDRPPFPKGIEPQVDPSVDEDPPPPPIRARAAGESRLAFKLPDGFEAPYTLEGLLDACQDLELNVPANAGPREAPQIIPPFFIPDISKLDPSRRVQIASFALRHARIAMAEGPTSPTLRLRAAGATLSKKELKRGRISTAKVPRPRLRPRPAEPASNATAIEMPWRLILSPHAKERWRHATGSVKSQLTGRTELWHSRLVAPDEKSLVIEPPRPDPARTVRAVWALTGEGSDKTMSGTFPTGKDLPSTGGPQIPFRSTLHDFDRFQISHLSSNYSVENYRPEPVCAHLLMLSSLGAWLDSRGAWDPPGLSVEEWVHRASMGRDHYVRVVYRGVLFPFGHRVALVKVSERKFHNGRAGSAVKPGNAAYLRQRMFIIVREKERVFADENLSSNDGKRKYALEFPFSSVRILTTVTPDLNDPAASQVGSSGQQMFWPMVGAEPLRFRCQATDLDGRRIDFEQALIFMDNSMASPRKRVGARLVPDFGAAEAAANLALTGTNGWNANTSWRSAGLKRQRVAFAESTKPGDTACEVETLTFGAELESLRGYSRNLTRPIFYPTVTQAEVRIGPLAHLTGSTDTNTLTWNAHYLAKAFADNAGQVFGDVGGTGALDFSKQGDRSGGFVMPNMSPSALSRIAGPVAGKATDFIQGKFDPASAFPATPSGFPLPLLFGCIPLGAVVNEVADLTKQLEKLPKFASEAITKLETLVSDLGRLFDFVRNIAGNGGSLAQAAVDTLKGTLEDLILQAKPLPTGEVNAVVMAIQKLEAALDELRDKFDALVASVGDAFAPIDSAPDLTALPAFIDGLKGKVDALETALGGATLPAGFQQSVRAVVSRTRSFFADAKTITSLIQEGKALYTALSKALDPALLQNLFDRAADFAAELTNVAAAMAPLRSTIAGMKLLDGAPKQTILNVVDALGGLPQAAQQIADLLGDELVFRFDWNPEIKSWGFDAASPLFVAHDVHGFVVAVEARVKKSGGDPRIKVVCSLKHFDLVLINPAAFLELDFEKIEFRVDSGKKMDVDVLLSDVKFVGPLSFVEILRDLIPLDGFSDPPHLDITAKGIDAGFSMALPNVAVGVFSLSNLSLGAGFSVPFIGQPLSVRFNFCTREQPFNLTVSLFGGGGFFAVTIDPHGVQVLEAALEFGASISIDFGVASGGVHVMAGIYYRMEQSAAALSGYFRLGGNVSVLGLISASLELYLELRYEFASGKCEGRAHLTIEVEVFLFSTSVTVSCERKFAGSNGDPSFRALMGSRPELTLADELTHISASTRYPWREYCEAFV
jgi:hypothetical protein